MTGLPGLCRGCGQSVVFVSGRWRSPEHLGIHACPIERATCGAWMRNVRDRCARRPGHGYEHRTRYAMDNALQMATGRRRAA